jgi:hypothetical protein
LGGDIREIMAEEVCRMKQIQRLPSCLLGRTLGSKISSLAVTIGFHRGNLVLLQ